MGHRFEKAGKFRILVIVIPIILPVTSFEPKSLMVSLDGLGISHSLDQSMKMTNLFDVTGVLSGPTQ